MSRAKLTIFRKSFAALLTPTVMTLWAVATVVAVFAGPFGTFTALGWSERAVYWAMISLSSVLLSCPAVAISHVIWEDGRSVVREVFAASLAVLGITAAIWQISAAPVWEAMQPPGFGKVFAYVALMTLAATLTKHLTLAALPHLSNPVTEAPTAPEPPRLLRRIPESGGAAVLHLSVQDHLVTITTSEGAHSLRMRFRDALEELDNVHGFRVHRSHWVARAAIVGVEREQSRLFLRLSNDARVPVSRNYRADLEKAGVIRP